jgi:hypothetical protein
MKKFFILWLVCTNSFALEVSYGMGEHSYSNDKDKRQACVLAENKAIDDALYKYASKQFETNQETFCVDTKEHAYCNYVKDITFASAGSVRTLVDRIQRTDKNTCYVEVKAEIEKARQLNANVKSKRLYIAGDPLEVEVKVGEPLYLYIFNLHKKGVDVLFPNPYNKDMLVDDRFTFPSGDVKIIASLDNKDKLSNETMLFLFTKRRQDIDYRDVNKDNLKELLKTIPVFEKKIVQHNFVIKRSEK